MCLGVQPDLRDISPCVMEYLLCYGTLRISGNYVVRHLPLFGVLFGVSFGVLFSVLFGVPLGVPVWCLFWCLV